MSDIVIRAEGLGKKYLIGHESQAERYMTLRDVLVRATRSVWRKTSDMAHGRAIVPGDSTEEFWALKNIDFEVTRGEVLGIIGRNGAGKSTLLKILSRITEPTEGRVTIKGRVASLLEVGTGFHPELTGRENIYLNGAILGMARAEIKKKFDEIVGFAEVERFLDTPVKRFSSGMYVRLAFAVAAHLEPEILIVDEVLAVGDFEFQKKCLGKMSEVAGRGRTVLFVSHNMQAVRSLCTRAIILRDGKLDLDSSAETAVLSYLRSNVLETTHWVSPNGLGDEDVKLKEVCVYSNTGHEPPFKSEDTICIKLVVEIFRERRDLCVGFDLMTEEGGILLRTFDTDVPEEANKLRAVGTHSFVCALPAAMLNARVYRVAPRIKIHNKETILGSEPLVEFPVLLTHGQTSFWVTWNAQPRPGVVAPPLYWTCTNESSGGEKIHPPAVRKTV